MRSRVDANPLWYHTIELAPGLVTPGHFDLRPIVDRLPWPDVRGKRCLDVGTYDGFLAFELERRGAAEVVALDIPDHKDWDWPYRHRAKGIAALEVINDHGKGHGFAIAREALSSDVERKALSVYELSEDVVGRFDVVVCGALMLHLRDPIQALERIRSVCDGYFMSAEEIRLGLSVTHPRTPLATADGVSPLIQWWVPNVAGHRRMLRSAGFNLVKTVNPYCVPFGRGHQRHRSTLGNARRWALRRVFAGGWGVTYAAALARPVPESSL